MGKELEDSPSRHEILRSQGAWLELKREIVVHFPETSPGYKEEGEVIPKGHRAYVDEVAEHYSVISVRRPEEPDKHLFHVRLPTSLDWSSYFRLVGFQHLMLVLD